MMEMILLVLATSCDSFFMSCAYGAEGIRISWKARGMIACCGTAFLGVSVCFGGFMTKDLDPVIAKYASMVILLFLGVLHLCQAHMKYLIKKHKEEPLIIRFQGVSFVIDIFLDETKADRDHSKDLSGKEAAYLGIALSLDSLAGGLAYGIGFTQLYPLLLLSFIVGILMLTSGFFLGTKMLSHTQKDVSWISGCMLILLALCRFK